MTDNAERVATVLVPVLFEIDLDRNEANGLIHWFCSTVCRERNDESPIRGDVLVPEDDVELGGDFMICETCGRFLDPDRAEEEAYDDLQHNDGSPDA